MKLVAAHLDSAPISWLCVSEHFAEMFRHVIWRRLTLLIADSNGRSVLDRLFEIMAAIERKPRDVRLVESITIKLGLPPPSLLPAGTPTVPPPGSSNPVEQSLTSLLKLIAERFIHLRDLAIVGDGKRQMRMHWDDGLLRLFDDFPELRCHVQHLVIAKTHYELSLRTIRLPCAATLVGLTTDAFLELSDIYLPSIRYISSPSLTPALLNRLKAPKLEAITLNCQTDGIALPVPVRAELAAQITHLTLTARTTRKFVRYDLSAFCNVHTVSTDALTTFSLGVYRLPTSIKLLKVAVQVDPNVLRPLHQLEQLAIAEVHRTPELTFENMIDHDGYDAVTMFRRANGY